MQENHGKLVLLALMSALAGMTVRAQAQCVTDADCSDPTQYCATAGDGGSSNGGSSSTGTGSTGEDPGSATTTGGSTGSQSNSGDVGSGTTATSGGDLVAPDPLPPSGGACLAAPEYWCKSDADCAAGQHCEMADRFGQCMTDEATCVTAGDCAAGLSCVPSWGSVSDGGTGGGTNGSSTTGGADIYDAGRAAEAPVLTCNPYPRVCSSHGDCDTGFECLEDTSSGSNSTGGSDDGVAEPPVFKQCEVKRLDCDSDADCSADWKCVSLSNQSGGLQSPVRWGAAGAIKNCYPAGLAALAETVYGLPTAPRLDAQYPGLGGGGGDDNGGGNSPTDQDAGAPSGSGGDGGGSASGSNGDSNGSGGEYCDGGSAGWPDAGTSENNGTSGGGDHGSTGGSSAGGQTNGGGAGTNGTGGTPDPDDCSAAHGLSGSSTSLIMLALGSLLARRRRRS